MFFTAILHRGLRNDFFFNSNLNFPIFIWTFIFPFLFGLLFSFFLWSFIFCFLFGLLFPFSLISLDFCFPFSLWTFIQSGHISDFFQNFFFNFHFFSKKIGRINHNAIMDMMSELVGYIREAIDRKQENMRRRRRRDALRLALVRLFEIITEEKTFSRTPTVIDADSGFLASTFTDYIDGARYVFGHLID